MMRAGAQMVDLISLLTTFSGRINRAKWWLGLVIIGVANVLGGMLLNPEFFTRRGTAPAFAGPTRSGKLLCCIR